MATTSTKNAAAQNLVPQYIALAIFILAYLPTFFWMWDRWFERDSYYSHGILVPFVTGYFIWQMKDDLAKTIKKESKWGIAFIIFGIVIYLFASLFRIYFISAFSMFVVFLGLVLHFYGEEIFKKLSFPLAFLVFMIPLPSVVIVKISFHMKLFAAQIATALLNDLRIPAIREGSIIKMRSAQVVVDDVCSGLRSLISLTALGSIFAYSMKSVMWKRVILFLSTIPIAIITNVIRVLLLASVSEIWGPEYAKGIHDFSGFLIFGIAFFLLLAVKNLIE
jgi:exosortase